MRRRKGGAEELGSIRMEGDCYEDKRKISCVAADQNGLLHLIYKKEQILNIVKIIIVSCK